MRTVASVTAVATVVVVAGLAASCLPGHALVAAGPTTYDAACERIITAAKETARLHNTGGTQSQIDAAHNEVLKAFDKAVDINPSEPQAYANLAVYYFNTHRFDDAVAQWEAALGTLSDGDARMKQRINAEILKCRYGKVSKERDTVYDGGKGNVTRALELVHAQLALRPSPDIYRDGATMNVMLASIDDDALSRAHVMFKQSLDHVFDGWRAMAKLRGWKCSKKDKLLTGWDEANSPPQTHKTLIADTEKLNHNCNVLLENGMVVQSNVEYTEGKVWHISLPQVALHGQIGVVSPAPKAGKGCWLHTGSGGIYTDVGHNVQMFTSWDPSNPQFPFKPHRFLQQNLQITPSQVTHLSRSASVLSMAVTSYYHFVAEALGKLILLKDALTQEEGEQLPRVRFVLPGDSSKNSFVKQYLSLLPARLKTTEIYRVDPKTAINDIHVTSDEMHFVDWEAVDDNSRLQTHFLTPKHVLNVVRKRVVATAQSKFPDIFSQDNPSSTIIYVSRKGQKMRDFAQEDELVAALTSLDAVKSGAATLVLFDGTLPIKEAIALFNSASVVVGVHGGALTNIIFCKSGTRVVEIGFTSSATQHFRHISAAQGLEYSLAVVEADARGPGAPVVAVDSAAIDHIAQEVRQHVAKVAIEPSQTRHRPHALKDEL